MQKQQNEILMYLKITSNRGDKNQNPSKTAVSLFHLDNGAAAERNYGKVFAKLLTQ